MRDREQRAEDRVKEALKPFARTKDDVDQELNLRGLLTNSLNRKFSPNLNNIRMSN
jgi:hypothetical protein